MNIAPFETEHFYEKYEFNTPYQLCNSDCETVTIGTLLEMAGMSLDQFGSQALGYTESQGNPTLRELIAASYGSVHPDEVIVLGSPVEGIYLASRAFLEPGDEVIVLSPAYDALINLFEHVVGAANVKRWCFSAASRSWALDLDKLRGLVSKKTRLLVVNFPHNPTGFLPTPELQRALVDLVEGHELWMFSDEMYFGLVHSGTTAIPSAADLTNSAIVLSGLSKTYGLPGLRTGWLIVRDRTLRNNLKNWKFYTSICPPAPSEFLAIAAMRVWQELRDKNIAQVERNLALAEPFFRRWPHLFTWRPPMAGSTALVGYHVPSVKAVSETLASEAGILIHPGETLHSDDHHMRMGFGRAAFGEALERFEHWLKEQDDLVK